MIYWNVSCFIYNYARKFSNYRFSLYTAGKLNKPQILISLNVKQSMGFSYGNNKKYNIINMGFESHYITYNKYIEMYKKIENIYLFPREDYIEKIRSIKTKERFPYRKLLR